MIKLMTTIFLLTSSSIASDKCYKRPLFETKSGTEIAGDAFNRFKNNVLSKTLFWEEDLAPQNRAGCWYPSIEKVRINTGNETQDLEDLSLVPENQVQKIFSLLKNNCRIPFKFNIDGCYDRAHAKAYGD